MTKNLKNLPLKLKILYFFSKIAVNLSLDLHKGRPPTGEAFNPQKRTSCT
jgi:hypothetical protein